MELDPEAELALVPDLRHRVRHLAWFRKSFRHDTELLAARHGVSVRIDERRLAEAFLAWMEAFNRQKRFALLDRRDFSLFAAGLLLREFMKARPVEAKVEAMDQAAGEQGSLIGFWPEGFLYTKYCLDVLGAVMRQEFGEALPLSEAASDLRSWWSYRENVSENPSLTIAFLDEFVGSEPNWRMPDAPEARAAMRRATEKLLGR
jgi:hypothetical protein